MDERIIDLEIRLTHQEATLQTLNDVVAAQQQTIDRLMLDLEVLRQQLRAMAAAAGPLMARPEDEPPPPHY